MKMTFQRFKQIGKKTTAMILSVLIVSQFIDFSIISAGAEESGEPSVIQNEQAEPSSGEPDEPSQEESEPEEVVIGEQIEYDDLSVNNGYTLTEDKEVNNVILSGGTLDLNGHSLVVHGNVTVSYGTLYINRGYLNCLGNFSVSNYRSQLTMDNVNDKILVSGDFVWDYANSDSISNGVIEVKGDFKDNTTYNSYTFGSTGNNKVLLSGDAKQNIEQKNMHSFINILELDNHSQGGISAATPILAGTIIRNGCSINYPISGIYGYKLTQNDTIQGDVYLIGDELDLNGKTLNITGNLIQAAGKVNINGGTLNVAGDYLIESYTMDNDNNHVYDYSSGYLIMQNENDMVNVDGDFIMGSVQDHTGLLTSGVMNIKGDFEQKVFNYETNFSASGNHKVVFSGSGSQTVTFKKSTNNTSHFACVEFANQNQDGVHISDGVMAIGEGSNVGAKPIGHIYLDSTATIKDNSISANLKFPNHYKLADDLTVDGNIIVTGGMDLAGNNLIVENFTLQSSVLKINKGHLLCNGNMHLNNPYWYYTYIEMRYPEDRVVVNGNFVSENGNYYTMTDGILEIKGDFEQKYKNISHANEANFTASNNHKVIFSGAQKQTITFESDKSYFNIVEINNTSAEGVVVSDSFNHSELYIQRGNLTLSDGSMVGEKLNADKIVSDLYLGAGEYDLNGHTLTVTGDLIQSGGIMKINGGTLNIGGDYRIQTKHITENETEYTNSTGYLVMTDENDRVNISGDFITGSVNSHEEKLTDGIMAVGGDFILDSCNSKAFAASDNHKVILNGHSDQTVNFSSKQDSHFCDIQFANTSSGEIVLSGTVRAIGKVENTNSVLSGWLYLASSAIIENGSISANIWFPNGYSLNNDITINGDLATDGSLSLNGHKLTVNNLEVRSTNVRLNRGQLVCNGNLHLKNPHWYYTYIEMRYPEDRVVVNGNFVSENGNYYTMTDGILEIKGDFEQKYKNISHANEANFTASNNHKVIFNGTARQTISFESEKSYFNIVEIQNGSSEGIFCTNGLNASEIITHGNRITYNGNETIG